MLQQVTTSVCQSTAHGQRVIHRVPPLGNQHTIPAVRSACLIVATGWFSARHLPYLRPLIPAANGPRTGRWKVADLSHRQRLGRSASPGSSR